jgi:heme exporter protein D
MDHATPAVSGLIMQHQQYLESVLQHQQYLESIMQHQQYLESIMQHQQYLEWSCNTSSS